MIYVNLTPEQKAYLDEFENTIQYYMGQDNQYMVESYIKARNDYLVREHIEFKIDPVEWHHKEPKSPAPFHGADVTMIRKAGKYAYMEPERDEQGTLYGYKILLRHKDISMYLSDGFIFWSPQYILKWKDGRAVAHKVPRMDTDYGLHFTKVPDHENLMYWTYQSHRRSYETWALVRCALFGEAIAETEQGFRAHKALITHVFIGEYPNGYWQDYQSYSTGSRADPRTNPQERSDQDYQDYTAYYPYS